MKTNFNMNFFFILFLKKVWNGRRNGVKGEGLWKGGEKIDIGYVE